MATRRSSLAVSGEKTTKTTTANPMRKMKFLQEQNKPSRPEELVKVIDAASPDFALAIVIAYEMGTFRFVERFHLCIETLNFRLPDRICG